MRQVVVGVCVGVVLSVDVLCGQTLFPWVNSLRGLKGIRIEADAGENGMRNFLLEAGIQADAERLLRDLNIQWTFAKRQKKGIEYAGKAN